ncbi:MAG: site-specific integrase [Desulfobacterales bacterium]|nr:site-specific integrase [Desulfobacterales bacterium]
MPTLTQLKNSEYSLKPEEIKKVIYSAEKFRDRCIVKMFAQTGIRRAELASLDIRDVDFEKNLIYIREGKGGKSRTIPITEELASDLKHMINSRKTGPLFKSNRDGSLVLRQINWIVAKAGERSGIKNPNPNYSKITCHLFRHSFAREWKKRGGSIETLSKILGHTSIKTTLDEYGTEDLQDVQENYNKIMQEIF